MAVRTTKDEATIALARTFNNVPWCDEFERMVSGMSYNPLAPELMQGRFRARQLAHRYNAYFPADATVESLMADREEMLKGLFGAVGKGPYIEGPLNVDYGCNISIGDGFYANFNLVILDCGLVTIGDRVLFGPNVSIFSATHETSVKSRRDGVEYAREVTIGDDCWVGGNVAIMAGVHIGNGCTIGAGSAVTRDIPAWSVAVGCPARVIKQVQPVPPIPKDG